MKPLKLKYMPNKLTTEEAIENIQKKCLKKEYEFRGFVDGKYDGIYTKLILYCNEHEYEWETKYKNFINHGNGGCKKCQYELVSSINSQINLLSSDDVFENIQKICLEKGYEFRGFVGGNYVGMNKTKLILYCIKDDFEWNTTICSSFIHSNRGCPKCGMEKTIKARRLCEEDVIQNIQKICLEKGYEFRGFVDGKYIGVDETKLILYCSKHNYEWENTSFSCFMNYIYGCTKCAREKRANSLKSNIEEFIQRAKEVHGNKFDYSNVVYKNCETKVCIICPEHGEFWQTPYLHINMRCGCPTCNESQMEKRVAKILDNLHIKYTRNDRSLPCLRNNKNTYPFELDFFLPTYSIAIECQGRQHFEPVMSFGGEKEFEEIQKRDTLKRLLANKIVSSCITFTSMIVKMILR